MKKLLLLLLSLFAFNAFATPVNINTADAKTISDALSGIGMKKAEAIVKYRTEKGLFKTAEELTNVKGIGEKTLAKNKKDILLSDTPTTEPAAVAEPKTAVEPKAVVEPKKAK
ncbi:ComEA family DNA-binding protein [Methylobacter psychrophilus]|uniref:ComEA family DNA-binding protein n=1 Tax=Methylobacter psychrophilus TaxID=96941 RepID=UPI0021D4D2BE|nr:helix-hairpin-helix domain-containing protein [Methylobacter psychrophilus]